MKDLMKYRINLQHFAEGGEGSTGGEPGGEAKTFDDILQDKTYQSEFDSRVAKALETREAKLSAEFEAKLKGALEEQQRLAALSEEEKAKEIERKATKELADKQAQLDLRLLQADARELLADAGLSKEALNIVIGKDIEETKAKIEQLSKLIAEGVQAGIQAELSKAGGPGGKAGDPDEKGQMDKWLAQAGLK